MGELKLDRNAEESFDASASDATEVNLNLDRNRKSKKTFNKESQRTHMMAPDSVFVFQCLDQI